MKRAGADAALPSVLRQPILYFALLGAAVFALDYAYKSRTEPVVFSVQARQEVRVQLEQALQRPPSTEELQKAEQEWLDIELLHREAESLGLQHNDAVVRAHLARKLELLVRERSIVAEPTEAELHVEFESNRDKYTGPETFDVSHAFVLQPKNQAPDPARVEQVLELLRAGADPRTAGDHFPRGPLFSRITRARLQQIVGADLNASLQQSQLGKWQQVNGSRGVHLLKLEAIHGGEPDLQKLRPVLAAAVADKKKQAAVREFVTELRKKYRVVDGPAE